MPGPMSLPGDGHAWSQDPSGGQGSYVQGWELGMSRGGYTMGQVYQRGGYQGG